MWQNVIMLIVVGGAIAWLAWQGYRFLRPSKSGGGCAGGCCEGGKEKKPAKDKAENTAGGGGQTVFLPAEDLVRRVQARKQG